MTRIDDLSQKMDLEHWPHQFSKDGDVVQIGIDQVTGDDIFAAPMACVHCGVKFISGKDSRPPDPCPARTKKREMRRILG